MKQNFFNHKFMQALSRSYLVPCMLWNRDDEEFYARNILPSFRRFMKDLLPRLKKCDGSINTYMNELLITCANRDNYILPDIENTEIGAIITQQRIVAGQPVAGMVFGFTPKKIILAGGVFGLDYFQTESIKTFIEHEKEKYTLLADNEDFAESFGKDGFCRSHQPFGFSNTGNDLIIENNFAGYIGEIPARFITDNILPDIIIAHYKGARVINRFLNKALIPSKALYQIAV